MNVEYLKRAIKRSQLAYDLYMQDKTYLAAKRIYNANMVVYSLLQTYVNDVDDKHVRNVIYYIFHLEDWFLQFQKEEKEIRNLSDSFEFKREKGGLSFPIEYVKTILEL